VKKVARKPGAPTVASSNVRVNEHEVQVVVTRARRSKVVKASVSKTLLLMLAALTKSIGFEGSSKSDTVTSPGEI